MKKLITLVFILLSSILYASIDTIECKSKMKDVTLFFTGAQISRDVDLNVKAGRHILLIDELSQEINPQSIQVSTENKCTILSVKHQYSQQTNKSAAEFRIEDKIETQEIKIKSIQNQLNVYTIEEKILLDNSTLSNQYDGSKIEDIKAAADFYRERLNAIATAKLSLSVELKMKTKELKDIYAELNEETIKKRKVYSQVLIAIECKEAISEKLKISYYISSAGWEPMYDFRVDNINSPLSIVYNANVYQSSGEDWKNVSIKLSTSNPTLSGNAPSLETWYLGRNEVKQVRSYQGGTGSLKGSLVDLETREAIPFVSVVVKKGDQQIAGTATDFDGRYTIKPLAPGTYDIYYSMVGYNVKVINGLIIHSDKITFQDVNLESGVDLEAVDVISYSVPLIDRDAGSSGGTVTSESISKMPLRSASYVSSTVAGVDSYGRTNIRGSRAEETYYYIDGVKVVGNPKQAPASIDFITNSVKNNSTTLEYSIDIPYSIPSDGEDYAIRIKEVSLPVEYIYHAIPKLDNAVFLSAKITDWTLLNLLSGKTSIYYQGTFIGESDIDVNNTSDTLRVSLGRDRNILVQREGNKEMTEKSIIGNNYKETIAWNITIKNNKNTAIKIIVLDQLPLSQYKSVSVETIENSEAKVNENTGELRWEIDVETGQKKEIEFAYSLKYPRDKKYIVQ